MHLRDYSFIGTTQSLCPECLTVVPAKIVERQGRVYFRKHCPQHGQREDFVCSDVKYYDRLEYIVPARNAATYGVEPSKGCPYDCGLCTEHEQHTCIGLVEITSGCNLSCPMCYASSLPGGEHQSIDDCKRAIDRLVEVEGRPEVLQLSGGEPTLHPDFLDILDYAIAQPIDYIQINTNGLRMAHDPSLVQRIARDRQRVEVFFQLDGLSESATIALRGESLLKTKLRALELLGEYSVNVTLATTLQAGVNDDQLGPIVRFAIARPWITGVNFQPATYSGRYFLPQELEQRITFPDVIKGIVGQTDELFCADDFMPLPCAHPNCHSIAFAWRDGNTVLPLNRFIDAHNNFDLLANGICFTRPAAKELMQQYLARQNCCGGNCSPNSSHSIPTQFPVLTSRAVNSVSSITASGVDKSQEFYANVLAQQLGAKDLFRITITSFLDAYNFDFRRLIKFFTHHVLPSGHVIPFCAYNTLYRNGHIALPELTAALSSHDVR